MFGGVFAPTIVQRTWATAILGLRNLTSTSVIVSVLLAKTNSKVLAHLALNLRATPPPPAEYVHRISVFGEQVGVGPWVVLIPCGGLQDLHLANRGVVLLLSHGRD